MQISYMTTTTTTTTKKYIQILHNFALISG